MTANNCIVPNETVADEESPKNLGPYEIPGNGQGHLNKDMQKTIVAFTGWHVRSESRSCGGIIAGTTANRTVCSKNKAAALKLAVDYLINQQSTGTFPCDKARLGPLAYPSRNEPSLTEPFLADQVKVSSAEVDPARQARLARLTRPCDTWPDIHLVTLGWKTEGFSNKSERQLVAQICKKLSMEGHRNMHILTQKQRKAYA